jgi:DNA-binding transcriptional LysR family regulator
MDVWQLRSFVALAEALHFGRAAEQLHVSQPSLSRQIKHLERQLGVLLLNRDKHTVVLTPAGWALLHQARQIVGMTQRAEQIVRNVGEKPAGMLRLGVTEPLSGVVNGVVLRQMADRYPEVRPSLEQMSSVDQIAALRYRQLDAALVWQFPREQSATGELEQMELVEDDVCVTMSPTNELSSQSEISREDLAQQRILMPRRRENPPLYDELMGALRSWGISRPPIVGDGSSLLAMVMAGLGVCFTFRRAVPLLGGLVVAKPLTESLMKVKGSLVWRRRDTMPALRVYVEIARSVRDSGYWANPLQSTTS